MDIDFVYIYTSIFIGVCCAPVLLAACRAVSTPDPVDLCLYVLKASQISSIVTGV